MARGGVEPPTFHFSGERYYGATDVARTGLAALEVVVFSNWFSNPDQQAGSRAADQQRVTARGAGGHGLVVPAVVVGGGD